MVNARLVKPDVCYKHSFLEFVRDVKLTGYESYELYVKAEIDFEEFVKDLDDSSKNINVTEGWPPCSSFWLVDPFDEVIGVIRIRHYVNSEFLQMIGHIGYEIKSNKRRRGYGNKLFELGLVEAKNIGLQTILVTCDEENIGSQSIILNAAGKYMNSFIDKESGKKVLQYEVII